MVELATESGRTFPLPILGSFTGKDRDVLRVPAGLNLGRRELAVPLVPFTIGWPKWFERFITRKLKLTVDAQFEALGSEPESMSPRAQEVARALGSSATGALLMTIPDRATKGAVRPFQLVTSTSFTNPHDDVWPRREYSPTMDWLALVPTTRAGSDQVEWQVCIPVPDGDSTDPDVSLGWPLEAAACEAASKIIGGLSALATRSQQPPTQL